MSERDGGSAFPMVYDEEHDHRATTRHVKLGMTLRDYFAAVTLQGLVEGDYFDGPIPEQGRPAAFAERAYQIADAMLKARQA